MSLQLYRRKLPNSLKLILVSRVAQVEDVVWNAMEIAVSRNVPQATVSCSARVMQRSATRRVQLTRISAP